MKFATGNAETVNWKWTVPENIDLTDPMYFYVDVFLPHYGSISDAFYVSAPSDTFYVNLYSDMLSTVPVQITGSVAGWPRVGVGANPYAVANAVRTYPITLTAANMSLIGTGDVHAFAMQVDGTQSDSVSQTFNLLRIHGKYKLGEN
jgi:hypothetical protein